MQVNNTFQPLIERCADFDSHKHDSVVGSHKMYFGDDGRMNLDTGGGILNLGLEDLALTQLGGRLGSTFWDQPKRIIPTDAYRQMHSTWPKHFAGLTNDMLDKVRTNFMVRGYDDNARAILSDQYAKLDNGDLLDMVNQVMTYAKIPFNIVESGKYYSRNDGVQRDEMSVRVVVKNVLPEGEQGPYGIGFMIRNGETGGGASEVRPLIMRTSCMNSLVFKYDENGERMGLKLPHRGNKASKVNLLASAIVEALPMAEAGLDRYLQTRTMEIDFEKVVANLGKEYGWSEEARITIGRGSEGQSTVYGLVNGMTYAAHEMEVDTSTRVDMESLASLFVYNPRLVNRELVEAR